MTDEEHDPLGLTLGVLDDLFGGRARIHLLTEPAGVLAPLGSSEPPLSEPGPLHEALARREAASWHVDANALAAWDPSYRRWLGQGSCHVIARRIEGGGAVLGTLSVVRADDSRTPVVEDIELVQGIAGRLGRTSSVALVRAAARGAGSTPSASPAPAPSDAAPPPPASPPPDRSVTAPTAVMTADDEFDLAELTVGSVRSALALDDDTLEVVVTSNGQHPGLEARATLASLLHRLSPMLGERMPRSGLAVEVGREAGEWVVLVRPRDPEEAWPSRPEIDPELEREANAMGASLAVVVRDRGDWLVEITVRGLDAVDRPPAPVPVDLMSISLGDTEHMVMLAVDADRRVVFCNDELARRLGSSVADLLGRPLSSARGPSGAWPDFDGLFARVDREGLVQETVAWPQGSVAPLRWTVSRSSSPEAGEIYLCFGVEVDASTVS